MHPDQRIEIWLNWVSIGEFTNYKEAAAHIQALLADAPVRLDADFLSYLQLK